MPLKIPEMVKLAVQEFRARGPESNNLNTDIRVEFCFENQKDLTSVK